MSQSPDLEPMTAAIIGTGLAGGYHVKTQAELGSDIVVFDPNTGRAQDVARQYSGQVSVARTLEEAIEQADVVHICTPPMYHAEGALTSIEHGKPTIIEKPVTHDVSEAIEIYEASKTANVPIMAGMHYRLTPAFLKIHEGVQYGEIGTVTSICSRYVHDMRQLKASSAWRDSLGPHGFIYEGAIHAIDLNMWLAEQPVDKVQATIGAKTIYPTYGWNEDYSFTLTYADGTVGRVWSNAVAAQPRHGASIAVFGSQGDYEAHNKSPFLRVFKEGHTDWAVEPAESEQTIQSMASLFHDYIRGARSDFGPMPTMKEAIATLSVIATLEKAAETGNTEEVPQVIAGSF